MDDVSSTSYANTTLNGDPALTFVSANATVSSMTQERTGPRILRGVTPIVDESLIGLIARSCAASHMPLVTTLLSTLAPVGHAYMNLACREDIDFSQLAWAARLPAHEVRARLYAKTKITSKLPGFDFHGATIGAYDLILKRRRFAPSWLQPGGHHSALGHLGLLTHCPRTGELLIDRCPRCQTGFTWSSADLRHCHSCMLDLRSCEHLRITGADLQSTSLMSTILHPDPKLHQVAMRRLPESLAHLDRGTAFELGWRVGSILAGAGQGGRDEARNLPVSTRMEILKVGSTMLTAWPEGVRTALSETASTEPQAGLRLTHQLRLLARGRNAWPCHADIILDAIPDLASSSKTVLKNALGNAGNAAETQRMLGVAQRTFERLWKGDIVRAVAAGGTLKRQQVFRMDELRTTAALLADRMELGSASQRLGISHHGVEQLCAMDLLKPLDDPAVRVALLKRQISRSSFDALLQVIENNATAQLAAEELTLRRAMSAIGGREKPWGPIIAAMIDRRLPFRLMNNGKVPLVDRVLVPAQRRVEIIEARFTRPRRCAIAFTSSINGRDAEELLNVTPRIFQEALAAGEVPTPDRGTYNRGDILRLAGRHISGGEILARWGQNGRRMPVPIRALSRRNVKPRLGWHRRAVELLMADYEPGGS